MKKIDKKAVSYIQEIKQILASARQEAYSAVNFAMVEAYWLIGKRIVEEEQNGKSRADYGERVIQEVSKALTEEFGKGFSERSIRQYRQFYQIFPVREIARAPLAQLENDKDKPVTIRRAVLAKSDNEIRRALLAESRQTDFSRYFSRLNWTHIQRIMRVANLKAREYYLKETAENSWSSRTLDRNISTMYYERLLSSQIKKPVVEEMREKTESFQLDKFEFIKNPAVLEFLALPNNIGYTESTLEQAIIDQMQKFLLELGKGFAFVERQQFIRTETSEFYIDLVFYNYILKCFVIIELKTTKITHQDIGQLDMYVRMYDDLKRSKDDNPTIGLLLCTETDKTIAKYSVLKDNQQLFAAKYMSFLPTEEELAAEIERQKVILKLKLDNEEVE
ncbi:MAG: PDDEXK nuclease domain-containing protein [Planctomycetaceae bacterium]|jgi:predicted nuclease of restriction endonuclease-like (RecB) superfamily|nr:PDDEXK nuclease domain-containing protein [Planctomycetaceae bacterium]